MTTDRHPIDDAPLPDGLHDDEYPAADDDYGDFGDGDGSHVCAECGIDFDPTDSHAAFYCDDCFYEALML